MSTMVPQNWGPDESGSHHPAPRPDPPTCPETLISSSCLPTPWHCWLESYMGGSVRKLQATVSAISSEGSRGSHRHTGCLRAQNSHRTVSFLAGLCTARSGVDESTAQSHRQKHGGPGRAHTAVGPRASLPPVHWPHCSLGQRVPRMDAHTYTHAHRPPKMESPVTQKQDTKHNAFKKEKKKLALAGLA